MDIPTFDPDALSRLTQKIETSFKNPPSKQAKSTTTKDQTPEKGQHSKSPRAESAKSKIGNGTKRLRNGDIKTASAPAPQRVPLKTVNNHTGQPDGDRKSKLATGSREKSFLQETSVIYQSFDEEVIALGGTQEDIELIEDVTSESEIEGTGTGAVEGVLLKDVQRFVQDLGIKGLVDASSDMEVESGEAVSLSVVKAKAKIQVTQQASKLENGDTSKRRTGQTGSLKFQPVSEWHTTELPTLPDSSTASNPLQTEFIDNIHSYAKQLLAADNEAYSSQYGSSSSSHQFYSTIMSVGTLSDKISALTLSVQESPIHNMRALESLVTLAKKRSRSQAVEVLGALKDLFGPGSLLPSDRKLKTFGMQPALSAIFSKAHKAWKVGDSLPSPLTPAHLIYWAFEDWLKNVYFEILKIIETWCNDEIVFSRSKALEYVFELLRDKPEQEANLLRLLINKLGDTDKKIASKASYTITQLQTSHPLMKSTIISSIESELIFRPGQSLYAKYYAVITLNQTVLSSKEEGVAQKLLDIYFSLFVLLLAKKESTTIATAPAITATLNKKGERQGGGGAPGKKAQKKLEAESKSLTVEVELGEKLLSAVLTGVNRAIPYAKMSDETFNKHIDTLFKVTHSSNFNTGIRALMLIQQLCGPHQAASDRFYRALYESLLDPRLMTSSKQAMYLNLLYRALRADLSVQRVEAFAKRLLQVVAMHQPPFACAVLYLLRELESVFPRLQSFIDQPEEESIDDEEEFHDVGDDRTTDQPARADAIQALERRKAEGYDGRKREPEYSNADRSCLWEIEPYLHHYHPSVALFASRLLTHGKSPLKPDLSMHTLISFLDRFVYRNPKKSHSGPRGASIMQPLAGSDTSGLLVSTQSKKASKQPVNTEGFWKKHVDDIDANEVFFHKYFSAMGRGKESAKKAMADKKQDVDAEGSGDEDEDEIWEALVSSRPELEGTDRSDDMEMDDLDSDLGSDSVEDLGSDDASSVAEPDLSADEDGNLSIEDDEAILGSDTEIPISIEEKLPSGNSQRARRKKLKNLPTFASVEDYAAMLKDDEE